MAMFTQEELSRGAKCAVLKYLASNSIPIARIFSLEEARRLEASGGLEKTVLYVRSDSPEQWDGFSGVYRSQPTRLVSLDDSVFPLYLRIWREFLSLDQAIALATMGEEVRDNDPNVREVLAEKIRGTKKDLEWYCKGLALALPARPVALIQEMHYTSDHLFQHPNDEDTVVIGRYPVMYSRKEDSFRYFSTAIGAISDEVDAKKAALLRRAIDLYDMATSLPKFSKEWTYEMEFGRHKETGDVLVYQIRRFRKKEHADFMLEPKAGEGIINFGLAIGLTPKEGEELRYRASVISNKYFGKDVSEDDWRRCMIDISSNVGMDSVYPHICLPGIRSVFYSYLHYSHSHGARESLMKVPVVLCGIIEPSLREKDGFEKVLSDGCMVRVYSDGRRGRMELA